MHRLRVPSAGGDYDVVIGSGLLEDSGALVATAIASETASILLLYDEALVPFAYPALAEQGLRKVFARVVSHPVPSGEGSKSLAGAEALYHVCIRAGLDREAVIVALGGGVTGDLAGFVAATFMRGIRFIQMPTTVLAHDSSIGGKVAINLPPDGKNLVGAFHPPRLVLYDVATLATLPRSERSGGLAEAVKHGVIRDPSLFVWIEQHADELLAGETAATAELLARSCQVKVDVVGVDERESGLRAILNFGHTVGHAIEALSEGEWTHGACVAIGMMCETRIADVRGVLVDRSLPSRLRELLERLLLPVSVPSRFVGGPPSDALIELMRHDKKAVGRTLSFVLPRALGDVVQDRDVDESVVRASLPD